MHLMPNVFEYWHKILRRTPISEPPRDIESLLWELSEPARAEAVVNLLFGETSQRLRNGEKIPQACLELTIDMIGQGNDMYSKRHLPDLMELAGRVEDAVKMLVSHHSNLTSPLEYSSI